MTHRLPTLFLAHGNPMNVITENPFRRDWARLATGIPRPRVILCVSAHWCTRGSWLTGAEHPKTIHDFGGFPPALFACQYPCPGAPEFARSLSARLSEFNVGIDQNWGLDHGSWSVLSAVYPAADIPVVQLSLDLGKPAHDHWQLAQALRPLRDEGVLIVGSGNIVHNLARWFSDPHGSFAWAQDFDEYIAQGLRERDFDRIVNYLRHPEAREAVPTAEHYLPLLYIAGASTDDDPLSMSEFPPNNLENVSMRSVRFG